MRMPKIHSLFYHNPKPKCVERMVRYHLRCGYRFISIKELLEMLKCGQPIKEKLAFLSFDDGWQGNLHLLPIIEKYHLPVCIFVVTEPLVSGNFWWEYVLQELGYDKLELYKKLPYEEFICRLGGYKKRYKLSRSAMTVEELTNISHHPLVSIQSHTVTHPILTSCPDDVLEKELSDSKSELEKFIGQPVFAFSYPDGAHTEREIQAVKRHYAIAFTTEQKEISLSDGIYTLPRCALTGKYYRDLLKVWGIWKYLKRIMRGLSLSN